MILDTFVWKRKFWVFNFLFNLWVGVICYSEANICLRTSSWAYQLKVTNTNPSIFRKAEHIYSFSSRKACVSNDIQCNHGGVPPDHQARPQSISELTGSGNLCCRTNTKYSKQQTNFTCQSVDGRRNDTAPTKHNKHQNCFLFRKF